MLSMEPAQFRQISPYEKVMDASRDLGCAWSLIHSSAPPTLPNRSAGLCRRGHIRRGGLLRHVAIFSIRSQRQDPEILFLFIIGVYYDKLGHILKTLVPKFRPCLFARFRYIADKQVHAKLKPIVVHNGLNSLHDKSGFKIKIIILK